MKCKNCGREITFRQGQYTHVNRNLNTPRPHYTEWCKISRAEPEGPRWELAARAFIRAARGRRERKVIRGLRAAHPFLQGGQR